MSSAAAIRKIKLESADLERATARQRALEEKLRATPEFRAIVDALVNLIACTAMCPVQRQEMVDDGFAAQARFAAARLALVGMNQTASAGELAFARSVLEEAWRNTPILTVAPDESFLQTRLPNAEPWQIALVQIFQLSMFARHLVIGNDEKEKEQSSRQQAFVAVVEILQGLAASGLVLPQPLQEAVGALRGNLRSVSVRALPPPTRFHIEAALTFVATLRVERNGQVLFRVAFKKLGGRGRGRKLSPWGAASAFANCFGLKMADRVHDLARSKRSKRRPACVTIA